jgi:hypothetical protein
MDLHYLQLAHHATSLETFGSYILHLALYILIHSGVILRVPLPSVSKLLITVVYNMYLDVMGTGTVWAVKDMMQTVEWEERECSKRIKNTTITATTHTHPHSETLLRCVMSVLGVTPENIL